MELRHLRYLVTVADQGQFVRAAAELHVAQSALSQQVQDLEHELGTELLLRSRRGVTPTPAGEVLLAHAREILGAVEEARADVARLSGVVAGVLRIGTGSPSGRIALPAMLAEYGRRHPAVEIVIRDTTSEEFVRWLGEGTADIAVLTLPPDGLPERIRGTRISSEPLVALLPAGHRFAARERISLAALAQEPFVSFPRGSGVRLAIEEGLEAAGVPRPVITAETIDPLAMLDLVRVGIGVGLVPESVAELAGPDLRVLPLAGDPIELSLTLAWSRERRARPALDAFLELAAEWLPLGSAS